MSTFEFKLPDIGEGVTEGEIVQWLVEPGEVVREDQPLVEVMTDKATVTITAPKAGRVVETRGAAGTVVPVHSVLVVFDLDGQGGGAGAGAAAPAPGATGSTGAAAGAAAAGSSEGPAATAVGDIKEELPGTSLLAGPPAGASAAAAAKSGGDYFNPKPLATPATRKLARDLGVDLRHVPPTGPGGRVTKSDVRAMTVNGQGPTTREQTAPAAAAEPTASAPGPAAAAVQAPSAAPLEPTPVAPTAPLAPAAHAPMRIAPPAGAAAELEERIPLRGVRRRIFESMARSVHTAAHFTFVEECDATALKELRARLRPAAEAAGAKLTFLPFFVKAVVAALKKHPMLNAAFDEATQEIVVRRYYHIGIATSTDAGLVVPVVRDADRKSLLTIAQEIGRLADDAKAGRSKPQDLGGSTFTITSLGAQGGLLATPILNFPEVGILGVHRMKQKPVVRDGRIVIGDVMLLSLSFDHRLIDGHAGAAFAYDIIAYLENPDRLFLEMA